MDQFVVDVGPEQQVRPGQEVVIFGRGGAPASRRPRTGPRRPAPSPTRSSPASVPACPGSTLEESSEQPAPKDPDRAGRRPRRRRRDRGRRRGHRPAACAPAAPPRPWTTPTPTTSWPTRSWSSSPTTACRCTSRSTSPGATRPCGTSCPRSSSPTATPSACAAGSSSGAPWPRPATASWSGTSAATAARARAARSRPHIDQLGRDLARVIAEAAPEGPLVLVGHSMGGMTMMSLAVDHHALIRERVVAAAFIATSPGSLDEVSWGLGNVARQGRAPVRAPRGRPAGLPADAGQLGAQGRQGRRGLLRRPLLLRLAGAAEHRAADGRHDLRHPHGGHARTSW